MGRWTRWLGEPKVWARDIAVTGAMALTMGLLGPFGSYTHPFEQRLVESLVYGFGSGPILVWPLMRQIIRAAGRRGFPEIVAMVLGLAAFSLPISLISRVLAGLLRPGEAPHPVVMTYFVILAMMLTLSLAYLLVDRHMARLAATGAPATPDPDLVAPPKLIARLPPSLGQDILALQAEDHYVRVHTKTGSTLVLMRLADAIEELGALEGDQPHRSWWVARSAVAGGQSQGRRLSLTLINGLAVPVTREAAPRLRRTGWV